MNDLRLNELHYLAEHDELISLAGINLHAFLHRDHRWTLVIMAWAQQHNFLPKPCDLVMLDYHTDAITPSTLESDEGRMAFEQCKQSTTLANVISLCKNQLRQDDADWVKAGMEIGIIQNAVIFGPEFSDHDNDDRYTDVSGHLHNLWILPHISDALGWQGRLTDVAYRTRYEELWETLGWDPPNFVHTQRRLAISLDLDYFAVHSGYLDCKFAWPQAVYKAQFLTSSNAPIVRDYNARRFFDGVLTQCGCLDIAREPNYCGGEEECNQIFTDVNRVLFNDKLSPVT